MAASDLIPALQAAVSGFNTVVDGKQPTLDAKLPTARTALKGARVSRDGALVARDATILSRDAAYRDLRSAQANLEQQDLAELAASKALNAVDVFIYDTSKDSDGGAWRKRCAKTSWFNEPLNTEFRGARREFPAVAVIAATTTTVTIYDGDDPALPMWMVFRYGQIGTNGYFLGPGSGIFKVAMLNGVLSVGKYMYADLAFYGHFRTANFISEQIDLWIGHYNKHVIVPSVIAERNDADFGIGDTNSSFPSIGPGIVDGRVLDVAMTVMPDAPADPLTGLPVPRIAVATAAGVSVIKEDGSVTDSAYPNTVNSISFTSGGRLLFAAHGPAANSTLYLSNDATFASDGWATTTIGGKSGLNGFPLLSTTANGSLAADDAQFIAQPNGLSGLRWSDSETQSLLSYISASYNTGWMNGDIQGAFLSDTDDTDLVGSGELVTNGTFDTDTSGWTEANSSATVSSGIVTVENTANYGYIYQDFAIEVGKTYLFQYEKVSGSPLVGLLGPSGTPVYANNSSLSQITFTATSPSLRVRIGNTVSGIGAVSSFDNVSIKPADVDRSVNNKSLLVNGTITRSPVADGAELVAYSGFSTANYLEQPYNSALDFGTGGFCVMGWHKSSGSNNNADIFARTTLALATDDRSIRLTRWALGRYSFGVSRHGIGGDGVEYQAGNITHWAHIVCLRRSGTLELWIDGRLVASGPSATDASQPGAVLKIGQHVYNMSGSAALWRISATAPTASQIRKIYEDEKALFQENAACTLYGASDAVTALAHDPDTGLLHVGTSAGRSVFKGLRRVDNTTQPVTTAISAANGMVIEQ